MTDRRVTNLALQGGGAHGAFTWGILDALLEDGRLDVEGVSATSAGAVNAVVMAQGLMEGGREGGRTRLREFWEACALTGVFLNPIKRLPWEVPDGPLADNPLSYVWFDMLTRMLSPYQFNPFDLNPLRDLVAARVDFPALRRHSPAKLFLNATRVRTGEVQVFHTQDVSLDVVMASACLPFLFQAVEIAGEHYWDGGYMGNPSLWPLYYHCDSRDILILHVNPLDQPVLPVSAPEIADRINEISFNSSLLGELRAIAFVQKLHEKGWLTEEARKVYRYVHVHSIRADKALADLGVATKLTTDWPFLSGLFEKGRAVGREWLDGNAHRIGEEPTCDLHREYLARTTGVAA